MKRFDSVSIYNRMVDKLVQNPNWKAVVSDSVISSILKAVAEETAEGVRYSEHMFKETKWDTAQNISSITAAAGQLGYKPARKRSAFGSVVISADPRIHLLGRALPASVLQGTMSGWGTLQEDIVLSDSIVVKDSQDNSYVVASRSALYAGEATTSAVLVEGSKKTLRMSITALRALSTRSKLDPYIYIPVELPSCENASTPLTRRFFKVFVNYETYSEEYRVVDTLHLSTSADADVEVYPDLYNTDILYLKFNTSTSRGRILNLSTGTGVQSIDVQYLESRGQSGNISKAFETFTLTGIPGRDGLKLFATNLDPISGGSNEESVFDIKKNAPQFYMNTYTVATRESYENAIKRIDFGDSTYPTKVRVFAGTTTLASGLQRGVTWVSMLLPNLEDRATSSDPDTAYEDIDKTINFYLSELKAPVDTLKFMPPTYASFSVGLACTARREAVDNLLALKQSIRTTVDSAYGSQSSELDFNRSIYAADIVSLVKNSHPSLLSVKLEVEATRILNWNDVERVRPYEDDRELHTLRLPFSFNPVFRGRNYIKGFKDYQTGASYVMRFDVLYKQNLTSTLPAYHTSIFIKESSSRTKKPFFHIKDHVSNSPLWPRDIITSGYPMNDLDFYDELEESYQFYFKKRVYTDDAFESLIAPATMTQESLLTSYELSPGALDSYLVWFDANVDATDDQIGEGYFEFDIAPIYMTLQGYASQDAVLAYSLSQYPLANIQCGALSSTILEGFIQDVLRPYVEIHVSLRPLDSDLVLIDDEAQNNVVLLIDSSDDMVSGEALTNLSPTKKERMISVECSLV